MKLLLLGDAHITKRGPEKRLDNYFVTQQDKFDQVFGIFEEHDCEVLLQVGDFFDTSTVGNYVISTMVRKLKLSGVPIYVILGQHDFSGASKSTFPSSPLAVLEAAGAVKIIGDRYELGSTKDEKPVCIYGASFGEDIPKTKEHPEDAYNILVTHRMIGDRPLWPGHELPSPTRFLRKNPSYSLVVCGDYHYRFTGTYDGRTIINPGALVRKTVSKFDLEHQPAAVIFDTDTSKVEVIELKVRSVEEIFDLTTTEKTKDSDALLNFIKGIEDQKGQSTGWKHILLQVLKERN